MASKDPRLPIIVAYGKQRIKFQQLENTKACADYRVELRQSRAGRTAQVDVSGKPERAWGDAKYTRNSDVRLARTVRRGRSFPQNIVPQCPGAI